MKKTHEYRTTIKWAGERPITDYDSYTRDFVAALPGGRPPLIGSADPSFKGSAERPNPEDLLLVSVTACHMLSYLACAAWAGIQVQGYRDSSIAHMAIKDKAMRFTEVVLYPVITLAAGTDEAKADALHEKAHHGCFIANSVNFPITWSARYEFAP